MQLSNIKYRRKRFNCHQSQIKAGCQANTCHVMKFKHLATHRDFTDRFLRESQLQNTITNLKWRMNDKQRRWKRQKVLRRWRRSLLWPMFPWMSSCWTVAPGWDPDLCQPPARPPGRTCYPPTPSGRRRCPEIKSILFTGRVATAVSYCHDLQLTRRSILKGLLPLSLTCHNV